MDGVSGEYGPLAASFPNGSIEATFFPNGSIAGTVYNTTEVQTLAYQSIMDSLGKILVGTIANTDKREGASLQDVNTTVMSTVLSNTIELQSLTLYPQITATALFLNLQQYLAYTAQIPGEFQMWNGINVIDSESYTMPLHQALEELFRNITVSLMTSAILQ